MGKTFTLFLGLGYPWVLKNGRGACYKDAFSSGGIVLMHRPPKETGF